VRSLLLFCTIIVVATTLFFNLTGALWKTKNFIPEQINNIKSKYFLNHIQSSKSVFRLQKAKVNEKQKLLDILHYKLSFDLFPEERKFDASATITATTRQNEMDTIQFDFYDNYKINSVEINGRLTDFVSKNKIISIRNNYPITDTFEVKIDYSGSPERAGFSGFSFSKINGTSLVYTLSEPTYASSWFPCNDFPVDKALLDIWITNDSSQVSVSNGILVDVEQKGSRTTYHWKTSYPISTYLIALYSSDYVNFNDQYISIDNRDTMAIKYYVLANDYQNAKIDFEEHPKIIKYFAETFGEYPFIKEKYGVAEFLWQLGAMEHQTITGVASNILGGKKFFEDIYVHEVAHHWWGDAVGPKSWNDIWLNEGFSTYCEALFDEHFYGTSALQSKMVNLRMSDLDGSLINPGSFLFTQTVYNKGAWVLHMLRWELGDKIFFEILRKYYDKYKYSNASTDDFRRICELVSGIELTHFFDQWVKNVGMIELSYDWATEQFGDSCFTFLEINQEQKEYEEYHFSLEIALQYENNIEYRRLFINKKAMQFRLSSKQIPDDVLIDPKNNLLIISQQK